MIQFSLKYLNIQIFLIRHNQIRINLKNVHHYEINNCDLYF